MPHLRASVVVAGLFCVVAWGTFLRIWNLGQRPFWRDEAWVASAAQGLSCSDLLRQTELPLPPLFGVITRLAGHLPGPCEVTYRLFPALCGILVVPLVYAAARCLGAARSVALAVTGLCASGMSLVIWSRELKQYSFEALTSVLAAWLVFRVRQPTSTGQYLRLAGGLLALAGVGPWVGYGATIPLGVLVMLLFARSHRVGGRGRVVALGVVGLGTLALSVAVVWQTAAREQASNAALVRYIMHWYIEPASFLSWARAAAYWSISTVMLFLPGEWFSALRTDLDMAAVGFIAGAIWWLALLGIWRWPRRHRLELAWWTLGPWAVTFVAALAHRFPLGMPRMSLFWAPPMIVAATYGLTRLLRRACMLAIGRPGPALVVALSFVLVPVEYAIQPALTQRYVTFHDIPRMLRTLARERLPGEPVYVQLEAAPCVRYYAPALAPPVVVPPTTAGTLLPVGVDEAALVRHAAEMAKRRFWVIGVDEGNEQTRRFLERAIRDNGFTTDLIDNGYISAAQPEGAQLFVAWRKAPRSGK